jgi:hypothetical protein
MTLADTLQYAALAAAGALYAGLIIFIERAWRAQLAAHA